MMLKNSAALAHRITWKSSKQSYLTALLLADRDLVNDCLRAYAYFRWADDLIDVSIQSEQDRGAFITRQKTLIDKLYLGERVLELSPEEQMLADLIRHDRGPGSGLHSFIYNFMEVIEFDNNRRGRLVSEDELAAYTNHLAAAVIDGLQYFIGNGHAYPQTPDRAAAVTGAHITHMLRDMLKDIPTGIINIPLESIHGLGISSQELESEPLREWVRGETQEARQAFETGRRYINSLDILRCKLAGIWYLARFERILISIEREGYRLRPEYPERHCLAVWMEMVHLGINATLNHVMGQSGSLLHYGRRSMGLPSTANLHSQTTAK